MSAPLVASAQAHAGLVRWSLLWVLLEAVFLALFWGARYLTISTDNLAHLRRVTKINRSYVTNPPGPPAAPTPTSKSKQETATKTNAGGAGINSRPERQRRSPTELRGAHETLRQRLLPSLDACSLSVGFSKKTNEGNKTSSSKLISPDVVSGKLPTTHAFWRSRADCTALQFCHDQRPSPPECDLCVVIGQFVEKDRLYSQRICRGRFTGGSSAWQDPVHLGDFSDQAVPARITFNMSGWLDFRVNPLNWGHFLRGNLGFGNALLKGIDALPCEVRGPEVAYNNWWTMLAKRNNTKCDQAKKDNRLASIEVGVDPELSKLFPDNATNKVFSFPNEARVQAQLATGMTWSRTIRLGGAPFKYDDQPDYITFIRRKGHRQIEGWKIIADLAKTFAASLGMEYKEVFMEEKTPDEHAAISRGSCVVLMGMGAGQYTLEMMQPGTFMVSIDPVDFPWNQYTRSYAMSRGLTYIESVGYSKYKELHLYGFPNPGNIRNLGRDPVKREIENIFTAIRHELPGSPCRTKTKTTRRTSSTTGGMSRELKTGSASAAVAAHDPGRPLWARNHGKSLERARSTDTKDCVAAHLGKWRVNKTATPSDAHLNCIGRLFGYDDRIHPIECDLCRGIARNHFQADKLYHLRYCSAWYSEATQAAWRELATGVGFNKTAGAARALLENKPQVVVDRPTQVEIFGTMKREDMEPGDFVGGPLGYVAAVLYSGRVFSPCAMIVKGSAAKFETWLRMVFLRDPGRGDTAKATPCPAGAATLKIDLTNWDSAEMAMAYEARRWARNGHAVGAQVLPYLISIPAPEGPRRELAASEHEGRTGDDRRQAKATLPKTLVFVHADGSYSGKQKGAQAAATALNSTALPRLAKKLGLSYKVLDLGSAQKSSKLASAATLAGSLASACVLVSLVGPGQGLFSIAKPGTFAVSISPTDWVYNEWARSRAIARGLHYLELSESIFYSAVTKEEQIWGRDREINAGEIAALESFLLAEMPHSEAC
ncbi:unnamed protein product [Amoebophrya sp. A120]|nr:unnamed protein product [Amoebophrya sp. A120]|eukprot:GSA120T00020641001.1